MELSNHPKQADHLKVLWGSYKKNLESTNLYFEILNKNKCNLCEELYYSAKFADNIYWSDVKS